MQLSVMCIFVKMVGASFLSLKRSHPLYPGRASVQGTTALVKGTKDLMVLTTKEIVQTTKEVGSSIAQVPIRGRAVNPG